MWTSLARSAAFAITLLSSALPLSCGSAVQGPHDSALTAGAAAPEFDTISHTGERVRLLNQRGHPVVLYFYPKDDTPGCTKEACSFRDAWRRFEQAGARVYGVSRDSLESHREFASKHQLPFSLLDDEQGRIAAAYGVSSFLGMNSRKTFLIDSSGRIARVFPDVDPASHANELLAAIAELGAPATP